MRRISIKVVTNARKCRIVEEGDKLKVFVNAAPIHGQANKSVIKALAAFYKIKKNNIHIVSGEHSRNKVIEIIE